ncbi:MAG: S41 family peptidase [Actinomycetota bacterium]|nr:S41 family peptidase [Actinomycetota bacterium]
MSRIMRVVLSVVLALVIATSAFAGGVVFDRAVPTWPEVFGVQPQQSSLGEKIEEAERLLDFEALEPSSEESRTAGAISGLLDSLGDPYAMYFNPDHFRYFNEQTDGEFHGIGVTIAERDGAVYVVSVIKGTPAEEAGVQPDDEIVSIDGVTRAEWAVDEVVKRIRGPEGSTVTVEMYRPETDKKLTFDIVRQKIAIPDLMTRMEGDVGYLRLLGFNMRSAEEVQKAIEDLEKQGAKGFVLDLRDNPGGLLQSAVDISSLFVKDGVIVRVDERNRAEVEHRATGDMTTDKPLVVLVNGNSASASEIVAGALQDYGRAKLVGEKSFGKGSVQTVERLSFGGGVKFTIAHYLTPKKRVIDKVGLSPDIEVKMEAKKQADPKTDTQLRKALEIVASEF